MPVSKDFPKQSEPGEQWEPIEADLKMSTPFNNKFRETSLLVLERKGDKLQHIALKELKFTTLTDRTIKNFRETKETKGQNQGIFG